MLIIEPVPVADLPADVTGDWQLCDLSGTEGARRFDVPVPGGGVAQIAFREAGLDMLRRGLARAGLEGSSFPWPPPGGPARAPYRGLKALDAARSI
jgi:hypothetical protein